jgi:hypothetical protein
MPSRRVVTGFGSRILNSIAGALIGIILIPAAFALFFVNEGGVDLSKTAAAAVKYDGGNQNGSLIYAVGSLETDDVLTDKNGFVKAEKRISLAARAEMFAWVETRAETTRENLGGSTETVYTYTYAKEWTAAPRPIESFDSEFGKGHENPKNKIANTANLAWSGYADSAEIGGLTVEGKYLAGLGLSYTEIPLNAETVEDIDSVSEGYIYISAGGTASVPAVGDIRVSYFEVKSGIDGMVIGRLDGSSIKPFTAVRKTAFSEKRAPLCRWFGTDDLDEAVSVLSAEHSVQLWVFRIVGTVLIYIAFLLLADPLTTVLSFIPFFGRLSRGLAALVLLPIALVVSAAAIIIAALLNNIVTFIALTAALILLAAFGIARKKKKAAA